MRPVLVVVALILSQDLSQVPLAMDRKVIEAFAPERADEPPGERIRPWRARRNLENAHIRPGEHIIEPSAEFAVPVADQELEPVGSPAQLHQQISRLLRCSDTGRMSRHTKDVHAPSFDLHNEQHVQALEEHRIDVEKVARQDARGLSSKELAPAR